MLEHLNNRRLALDESVRVLKAGGFMGHIARSGDLSEENLRRAVVYGSVMASFAVEEFGLKRLLGLTPQEIEGRVREFAQLTRFDV